MSDFTSPANHDARLPSLEAALRIDLRILAITFAMLATAQSLSFLFPDPTLFSLTLLAGFLACPLLAVVVFHAEWHWRQISGARFAHHVLEDDSEFAESPAAELRRRSLGRQWQRIGVAAAGMVAGGLAILIWFHNKEDAWPINANLLCFGFPVVAYCMARFLGLLIQFAVLARPPRPRLIQYSRSDLLEHELRRIYTQPFLNWLSLRIGFSLGLAVAVVAFGFRHLGIC